MAYAATLLTGLTVLFLSGLDGLQAPFSSGPFIRAAPFSVSNPSTALAGRMSGKSIDNIAFDRILLS